MPLKKFATLDEIPEANRSDAIELKDGSFAYVEETDTSSLAADLKEWKRKTEMAERATRKAVEEAERAKLEDKAGKSGITAEKLAEIRSEVRREVEAEVRPKLEEAEKAVSENRTLKLDTKVKALAATNGVRAERLDAWWKLHGDKFDLTSDGEPVVKGKEGVSLKAFIADDLKKELPDFYTGTQGEGGGAAGMQGRASTAKFDVEDLLKNPSAALDRARAAGAKE